MKMGILKLVSRSRYLKLFTMENFNVIFDNYRRYILHTSQQFDDAKFS